MIPDQPAQQTASSIIRAVLTGAGLGMIVGVLGTLWRVRGDGLPVDPAELITQGAAGTIAGAAVALVLHVTRDYRARGRIQHYCSWMLACVFGVFALVVPDLPEGGWNVILFSLWLGTSGGLALGIIARQLSGYRW